MQFPQILKSLRKSKGITQTELAKNFNVSKSTISMYELGEREPSFEVLEKLSSFFDVTIDYLLGNTDTKEQKEKTPSNDEDVKVALFGGDSEVTDEMWNEVKQYAEFIKSKYNKS